MGVFSFSQKESDASWFFQDFWDTGWEAYATNTASTGQLLSGIKFTFVSGNSGNIKFDANGDNEPESYANGAGCTMYCKATYGGDTVTSSYVNIPEQTTPNWLGDPNDNQSFHFDRDTARGYNFHFNTPLRVPAGAKATLKFYATDWTTGNGRGIPVLQVSPQAAVSDPDYYIVTFNLNGGTRTGGGELTQNVVHGQSANPPTCTKPGYRFLRWDGTYTNVTSNRTITAVWEALPIWRYNGEKWVQCLQSHNYDGTKWNDVDTFEFSTTWKEL